MAETFTWQPDFGFEERKSYANLVTSYESGAEQRRRKFTSPKRVFTLRFTNISKTDADAIFAFYTAREGTYGTFTWNNPFDGTNYTVRFIENSLVRSMIAYQIYNMSCSFIEVI